jgi:ABC-type amino acid transport system permease subunit
MLATIVGVVAGVLRLSKNWLVSGRLMTVYVEMPSATCRCCCGSSWSSS